MERNVIRMRQYAVRKYEEGWSGNRIARELQIPRRPTTIGKIEAYHKGVEYEAPMLGMGFRKYMHYWNNERPHQELKYKIPKDVYFKDFKKED